MIPDYLKRKYELLKAIDSIDFGTAFDDIVAMALDRDSDKLTRGQYSIGNADSDKLEVKPEATEHEDKRGKNNNKGAETTPSPLSMELKVYPNPLRMNIKELTLEVKPNDQIHYIFITDDSGKVWFEKEVDQFQKIIKIDADHLSIGTYNILIENDGSFSATRFTKTK